MYGSTTNRQLGWLPTDTLAGLEGLRRNTHPWLSILPEQRPPREASAAAAGTRPARTTAWVSVSARESTAAALAAAPAAPAEEDGGEAPPPRLSPRRPYDLPLLKR